MEYIEPIILNYLRGTISDDDHRVLREWLELSPDNRVEFDRVRALWLASLQGREAFRFDEARAFERFRKKALAGRDATPAASARYKARRKPTRVITLTWRWAAVAATVLIVGTAALVHTAERRTDAPEIQAEAAAYQELTVPYGARSRMLLPDSSTVIINAGSTMRYNADFGRERRDIWLTGEGFFEVSKSATPFIVHSGSVQVRALGTKFNVRAYPEDHYVATTLVEGKLAVTDAKKGNPSDATQTIMMTPNQKLTIALDETAAPASETQPQAAVAKTSTPKLQTPQSVDPAPEISWKDNEWVIYRERLDRLAVKLERRYDVHITFGDERLKAFRFNGTLPDESLEQVLRLISIVSPIKYSVKGKTVELNIKN